MTTTELIELLKKYEKGGVTWKPREINFYITDGEFTMYLPSPEIIFSSVGDGLVTCLTLEMRIKRKEKKQNVK